MGHKNEESGASKKQLIVLGGMVAVLIAGVVMLFSEAEPEMDHALPTQPVEVPAAAPSAPIVLEDEVNASSSVLPTQVGPAAAVGDSIDRFFMALAGKVQPREAALPPQGGAKIAQPLPALNGGAVMRLPELRNPAELGRGGASVMPGMPTPIGLPTQTTAHQPVVIGGIACIGGECRATTSVGDLAKGSLIGGGTFATEKVDSITMAGIRTDKRFIAY